MPYVEIPQDDVSLYWRSNLPNDDLSFIRSNPKPVILLLHPLFMCTDFLDAQFTDPLLVENFHLIAFDSVSYGHTKNPRYMSQVVHHDAWVEGAIIARFCDALDLPPVHVYAVQNISINGALRFAMLWPEKCRTLGLCGVAGPVDLDWVSEAYAEIMKTWLTATDLEHFEEAILALSYFMFNDNLLTEEERDDIVEHWQRHYAGPVHSTLLVAIGYIVMHRVPLTKAEFARITCPVLIIQGDSSPVHPVQFAQDLASDLINVPDGAKLVVVANAPECITITRNCARRVNELIGKFVLSVERANEDGLPMSAAPVPKANFLAALKMVAELADRPEIAERDPMSLFAFSRVSPENIKIRQDTLELCAATASTRVNPLNPDGTLKRRFSERHWDSTFARPVTPLSRPSSAGERFWMTESVEIHAE